MPRLTTSTRSVDARMCLDCGFDGPALQGKRGAMTFACPECGADLYARPARSYAELEGFTTKACGPSTLAPLAGPRGATRPTPAQPGGGSHRRVRLGAIALAWAIGASTVSLVALLAMLVSRVGDFR